MPAVGSNQVDTWQGFLVEGWGRPITSLYSRDGVDGLGVEVSAWRQRPVTVRTQVDIATDPAVLVDAYTALVGTVVPVTDPFGTVWDGVTILECTARYFRTVTGTFRVTAEWSMMTKI